MYQYKYIKCTCIIYLFKNSIMREYNSDKRLVNLHLYFSDYPLCYTGHEIFMNFMLLSFSAHTKRYIYVRVHIYLCEA